MCFNRCCRSRNRNNNITRFENQDDYQYRNNYNCGCDRQVIKHQHVVKHRHDVINEYDVVHEHDYNYYDVVKTRDVVKHHDHTTHTPNYCGNCGR